MADIFAGYPGGKNGSGTYQKIINLMPPHYTYVEAFLGGGAIMRAKKPAQINIGIDADRAVVQRWRLDPPAGVSHLSVLQADAVGWLDDQRADLDQSALVYCDPPYLMSTRASQRKFYEVEMAEEHEHQALLDVLLGLRCMVMISGYWSELYAERLAGWRVYTYKAMTRGGRLADEYVWMNFPEPFRLHDYRYLGDTYREREVIKRQKERWLERLRKMSPKKRAAMLSALDALDPDGGNGGVVHG